LFLAQAAVRPAAAAWAADAPGDYGVQAAGIARAYALDPDPAFLVRLAEVDYAAGLDRKDPGKMREALAASLAAVAQRPFDFQSLSYAAASLWRLGRGDDARGMTADAMTVRFSPLVVASPDSQTGLPRRKP
jgi:hypothetical protein